LFRLFQSVMSGYFATSHGGRYQWIRP